MEASSLRAPIKAVLFDVDGTLVNTVEMIIHGLRDAYSHLIQKQFSDDELRRLIGIPLRVQMNLYGMDEMRSPNLDERERYTMDRYIVHSDKIRLWSEVTEAYEAVCDRFPTALVTSRNREELDWMITKVPVLRKSKVTVSATEVSRPKPDPEPALLACELLNLHPSETVFIGDATHDIHCAKSAGIQSVAVTYGSAQREDLVAASPDFLIDSPEEFRAWVKNNLLTEKHAK
ncbi:MAG: HAD family hydrolase [Armatimonadetes bacterium]|nr:HAD family hydrolase [Armatimonadota bacterium]